MSHDLELQPSGAWSPAPIGLAVGGFALAGIAALATLGQLTAGPDAIAGLIVASAVAQGLAFGLASRPRARPAVDPEPPEPEPAPPTSPSPSLQGEEERRLLQTERMASLGRMAAGVAHEFNNPAQHLIVNLPFLRRGIDRLRAVLEVTLAHPPEQASARERIDRAVDEAKLARTNADLDDILEGMNDGATKISELVRDLTTFSRLDSADLREVDLHEGIDAAIRLLGYRFKQHVEIHRHYGDLPPVRCHAGHINHVFMNLLSNAADAIPEQGNVWVHTETCDLGVRVRVTDDGVGFDAATARRVFDPFFTTKEPGQGTGLGLTTSHDIVRRHGGELRVRSDIGTGTVFTVELPLSPPTEAPA